MLSLKQLWKNVDCICIDFDSTICQTESLDDLAEYLNKGEEVKTITNQGMEGDIRFEDSLKRRLEILALNNVTYNAFLQDNIIKLTKGIQEFVSFFQNKNIPIYIISGGFDDLIEKIVKPLNIPSSHIFANHIMFDSTGRYQDFDRTKFTSHSGGKAEVINFLRDSKKFNNIFVIGDGVTDLEACPPADGFIGFIGNVTRKNILEKSEWLVDGFKELIEEYSS